MTRPSPSPVTDDGLVERVARAVRHAQLERKSAGYGFVCADDPLTEHEIADARAALAASDRDVLVGALKQAREALELAVPIIEEERESTVDCHTVLYRGSPDYGKVVDAEAVEYIATYDAALKAARAALIPLAGEL